jgi:transposase
LPRISDALSIKDEKLDRRVKLSSAQKEEILELKEKHSQRGLAKMFGVSRRTIQFILDPAKHEENLLRRKERGGWKQYYDKEYNRKAIKEHRDYKKELFTKGLLKTQENGRTTNN